MLPILPNDAEALKQAVPLLLWTGKQIKAWLEARQAGNPQAMPEKTHQKKTPSDVAIAVRISRLNVEDVRAFLAARRIAADVVVISNSDSDEVVHLPNEAGVWEELVREFYTAFTTIQAQIGARRFHIFLSAPAALSFAMGCTMSTMYDVHLYQWDGDRGTYTEVIRGTSRERLMKPARAAKR